MVGILHFVSRFWSDFVAWLPLPSASKADGVEAFFGVILKVFVRDTSDQENGPAILAIIALVLGLAFAGWWIWNAGTSHRQHAFDVGILAKRSIKPLAIVVGVVALWGVLVMTR